MLPLGVFLSHPNNSFVWLLSGCGDLALLGLLGRRVVLQVDAEGMRRVH